MKRPLGPPRFRRPVLALAALCGFLGVTDAIAQTSTQASDYQEVVSREVSIFVGADLGSPIHELISREVSIFVGGDLGSPFGEIVSREVSLLQPNGANWFADGGQIIRLPMLVTYQAFAQPNTTNWLRASGAGSLLSFPNLTSVVGNNRRGGCLRIEALNGGRVDMASVTTMLEPYDGSEPGVARGIQVLADGTNSLVDLSGLQLFQDLAAMPGSRLEARNGGTILAGRRGELVLRQVTLLALAQVLNAHRPFVDLQQLVIVGIAASFQARFPVRGGYPRPTHRPGSPGVIVEFYCDDLALSRGDGGVIVVPQEIEVPPEG